MKTRVFDITALLFLFGIAGPLFSMSWPFQTSAADTTTPAAAGYTELHNFGWNDNGSPVLGEVFAGTGPVRASGDGEILYREDGAGAQASRLPAPFGVWTAVDHGDGIISIYARMSGDGGAELPTQVKTGEELGLCGQSGWSQDKGCYFSLYDRKERRWVNPMMIITPLNDERAPALHSVFLVGQDGTTVDPSQVQTVGQGRWHIYVNADDTRSVKSPVNPANLAPGRIVCSVNGIAAGALAFDTFQTRDGVLMVDRNGLVPVKEVYALPPSYEAAYTAFTNGVVSIEVVARDIAGNSRSLVYKLQVQ